MPGEQARALINNAPTEREIKQFSRPRAARVVTFDAEANTYCDNSFCADCPPQVMGSLHTYLKKSGRICLQNAGDVWKCER